MWFKKVVIVSFFILSLTVIGSITNGLEKLIIDTDAGIDDAVAIFLLLSALAKNNSNSEIVAITCVYGNTEEQNVEKNVLRILSTVNASHIPVYGGARKPIIEHYSNDNYFGQDGLGDVFYEDIIPNKINSSVHAALALVNLAKQYNGSLSILVLGPLTNIAIATMLDPHFANNVKKFYIMGGSVSGVGNKAPGVEFNFGCDPDSVWIALNAIKDKPSILFPWETTINSVILMDWRMNVLGSKNNSKIINFLNKAEQNLNRTQNVWQPADAMIAAVVLWPDLIDKILLTNVNPIIDGKARGSLLVDYSNLTSTTPNIEIIQEFNVEKFKNILITYFS
ncbi:probable uridine nucleosidase 1 isoform X2 [Chelonus insularis]|uniref:probable uridine nucleosidase 1 isoform X2 n=1 Tax=Chelonus insularis TaxID=460826 RepID=UPI00158D0EBF|nr:probable uridine nucleosidase 1 isoform X2 [Chelonus insularis]